MKISEEERLAIREVVEAGRKHGFGNMICHLATAWQKKLVDDGTPEELAIQCAYGLVGYPFAMQEDLMDRGEWDETGERYKQ